MLSPITSPSEEGTYEGLGAQQHAASEEAKMLVRQVQAVGTSQAESPFD